MKGAALAVILAASLSAAAGSAAPEKSPSVSLTARPAGLVVGRAWNVVLAVRGSRPVRVRVMATSGRRRVGISARRWRKERYRGRLVFPAAGRWTLTAQLGRKRFRLGAVLVRAPAPVPLVLTFPTQAVLDANGSLLVVETGSAARIARIHPATGRAALVARIPRPFGVVVAPSGALYGTDGNRVVRIEPGGGLSTIAVADSDVGPLAVDGAGNVYFTTAARIFRIDGGTGPVTHLAGTGVEGGGGDGGPALAAEFRAPHGLAIGADGALYVSDTGNNRVRRIDLARGIIDAFAPAEAPGGLSLGPGGALYVGEFGANRVSRIDPNGARTVIAGTGTSGTSGDGGPATAARLDQPADVVATPDGTVYIIQSGATGRIRRVAPSGMISTVARR